MSIAKDLFNAARDYFASGEEAKAYTLLSDDDRKAVPMLNASGGGRGSGFVQTYSSWSDWDSRINQVLNNWGGRSRINYAAEVGDLRLSVLLMAAVRWAGTNLGMGRIQVVELDGDEKETPIKPHPFTDLMARPNPEANFKTLMKQFAVSWVIAGESYFVMARDNAGRIKELWYEPHNSIAPRWDRNLFPEDETANEFIQYFEIFREGRWIPVRKMDVFRVYDLLDPVTRRGSNAVDALMRTIFTDNEREQYTALLLKNFGVTPKAVAPKNQGAKIDQGAVQESLTRKFSGDDRGKPAVFNEPMDVLDFGTDFSTDAMEKIAHISESRVAAALGISVQSLKFLVAQQSSTYNNVREFRREDYEQWIMPTHEDFLAAAENQILRDMDASENLALRFDYSRVPIVQRDKMETAKETELLVKSRVIDQSEARERHGYAFDDAKYRDVFYPVPAANVTQSPIGASDEEPVDSTKALKGGLPEKALDDAADYWRTNPALSDSERELMDAKPYVNGKVS